MSLELKEATIIEYETMIHPAYLQLFPAAERRTKRAMEMLIQKGITKVIMIMDASCFVGFFIVNIVKNINYIQLDYFAILPPYQSKGYGSEALKKLQALYSEFRGIYIEIEKLGDGKSEEENTLRKKRARFYERNGFFKMDHDIKLMGVIYTPYVIFLSECQDTNEAIFKDIFKIYETLTGKLLVKLFCKIIK